MTDAAENQEVDLSSDDEIEIEIQDDTPEEDRGRARKEPETDDKEVKADTAGDDDDEDLSKHSESVQKRIKKLKYEYHEERRRKEAADREREAALAYAEKVKQENERLRKNLTDGESVLITQAKARVTSELDRAKQEYKAAYEAGDADAVLEAQSRLIKLQSEADRIENWKPQKREEAPVAEAPKAAPRVPEPDPKAKAWVEKNDWFQRDQAMTRYAMLIHEELVESGVDSRSDLYYNKIDEAMRARYPDRFGVVEPEVQQPQRRAGSVVAPAGRNTPAPRNKVVITSSEAAIARRLGISVKDYAAQKLKDMQNG